MVASAAPYPARSIQAAAAAADLLGHGEEETETTGLLLCMSGRYEGDWVDGKYEGFGVETWARGSRYKGQFKMGLRHGFRVYRFYTGDVYAGE
ncbi:hypothetical protein AHAS_Ahas09G0070700 [Arachis hypogaea]